MKFFLDENESPAVLAPLRAVFFRHEFMTAHDEGLRGTLDPDLIREVKGRGFDAIMTQDRNQLSNREERAAYIETGLHWIGHREPDASGLQLIAVTASAYLAAMPHILDALSEVTGAHSFRVVNFPLQSGQRVKINPLNM
ncbi:hypothetical protein ACFSL4_01870 [Streptomyces caeni]|uniref:VapC45 PIN like domain-containing protein n=1 Tax=Streptomyces caeni TaxID=2307231 RepID=A0ABW4II61_9ACTN